ncbi:MAG: hypothetical protein HY904_23320 [Deltaproteobacteria bacterium]|nr:hypothetical protein [Deltaproteobacteria bacterium]
MTNHRRNWMNGLSLTTGVAGLVFGLSAFARTVTTDAAASGATIPYQGFLEKDGVPISTAAEFTFELYDDPAAGNRTWGPETHTGVLVAGGLFSVALGSSVDLPDNALGGNRWLQVTVDGTPLGGRQLLGSVPFARRGAPGQDFLADGNIQAAGSMGVALPPGAAPSRKLDVAGDAILQGPVAVGSGTPDAAALLDVMGTLRGQELTGPWDHSSAAPIKYAFLGDILLMWADTGVIPAGGSAVVDFPVPFVGVPQVSVSSVYRQDYQCSAGQTGTDYRRTDGTGMTIHVNSGNNNKCSWIAIGRWR